MSNNGGKGDKQSSPSNLDSSAQFGATSLSEVSDVEIFDRLKKTPTDCPTISLLLCKLYSTSARKKASALLRSGGLDAKFVFQQWLKLVNDVIGGSRIKQFSGESEGTIDENRETTTNEFACFPLMSNEVPALNGGHVAQRVKILAIALIWLLEEQQHTTTTKQLLSSSSSFSNYIETLRFLSRSVEYLHNVMLTCSTALMELANESVEQMVKALVIFVRRGICERDMICDRKRRNVATVGSEVEEEKEEEDRIEMLRLLTNVQHCITGLLQQHNNQLCLSKAVLSQCGMAYALLNNILQPAPDYNIEFEHYLSRFQDASLVCVLHGLMVPLGHSSQKEELTHTRAGRIEQHHKLILQTLMRFTSSQDPVLLTLTVRTIALWANLALSGCWSKSRGDSVIDQSGNQGLLGLSLEDPLCARLELAIWDLWDTHVEMAKGHLREIFDLLLKLHFKNYTNKGGCGGGEMDVYVERIVRRCMECDFEKKKPYHVLQIVVDHVPAPAIVRKYPALSRKLLHMLMDQSKSQICQMTLTKMVHSHWRTLTPQPTPSGVTAKEKIGEKSETNSQTEESWEYVEFRRVWVDELLAVQESKLSDSFRVNAGFINYIKVLFKVDPKCFHYIMAAEEKSHLKLTVKLMIVKSAIDQNLFAAPNSLPHSLLTPRLVESRDELQTSWRGIVSMAVMQEAVWSYSSQVLQDVLWLLVHPTKSTTEPLLVEDVQLLKQFYCLNLTNQSPAFRHNVYQWTNRLFLRMRDRMLMKKSVNEVSFWQLQQHLNLRYKEFLIWMLELCWDSFYLDASFSRKHLCLQFVRDILTIFGRGGEGGAISQVQGQSQTALDSIQLALVHWITGEEENDDSRVQQLIGLFHDSVQMNKDVALDIIMLLPLDKLKFVGNADEAEKLFERAMQFGRSVKSEQYPAAANIFILLTLCPSQLLESIIKNDNPNLATSLQSTTDLSCFEQEGGGRGIRMKDWTEQQSNLFILISFLTAQVSRLVDGMAGMKLLQAATTPIHGLLHCIFALVKQVPFFDKSCYGSVVGDLVRLCISACDIVFPVVKQVAPEGYMPPDSEVVLALDEFKRKCAITCSSSEAEMVNSCEMEESSSQSNNAAHSSSSASTIAVTAQMVVFCSWRIVKEACFILADLVVKYKAPPPPPQQQGVYCALTAADIVTISDYITKLVVECRHLGAFEKSFLALQQIIKFLWHEKSHSGNDVICEGVELNGLPDLWIERVLEEVRDPEKAKRFCLTRRSAGVPRYLEALLTTCPQLEVGQKVKKVFGALLHCAAHFSETTNQVTTRSKIHALNILRYLFRCSAIGQLVHSYVTEALITSLNGFTSLVWPVQNASNLLFTAILSRVFGVLPDPMKLTRKNCMSFGEFFSKFPDLHDFLLLKLNDILGHYKRDGNGTAEWDISSVEKSIGAAADEQFEVNLRKWKPTGLSIEHLSPLPRPPSSSSSPFCASSSLATNALLYPILLLLERLFVSENENEHKSYNFFFSLLRYLDWPVARIRLLVARAVPNFVTDRESIQKFIHFLFNIILPPCCAETTNAEGPTPAAIHCSKLNSVHGALLTVKSLCDTSRTCCVALEAISKQLRSRFGSWHQMRKQWPVKQIACSLTFDLIVELWSKCTFVDERGSEQSRLELEYRYSSNNESEELIQNLINQIRTASEQHSCADDQSTFNFDTTLLRNCGNEDICLLIKSLSHLINYNESDAVGNGTNVKRFLEGSQSFQSWLSEMFMEKDAFCCEGTIALCNFVLECDLNINEILIDHITQHLHLYAEECRPQLVRLLSHITFHKRRRRGDEAEKGVAELLFVCSKPFQPESVRLAVAQVLTEQLLRDYLVIGLDNCDELHVSPSPSLCLIWMPVFLLIFDDCPQIRQVICFNVSPTLQSTANTADCTQHSRKGGTMFSPMKLFQLLVIFLESTFSDDNLFVLFESLLQYQLAEICGLDSLLMNEQHSPIDDEEVEEESRMEEDGGSSSRQVLFEPTELNTFKESFRLVETSLNVIGRRRPQPHEHKHKTTTTEEENQKKEGRVERTIKQSIEFLKRDNLSNAAYNKVFVVLQKHIQS